MSLLLTGALIAGGILLGRFIARGERRPAATPADGGKPGEAEEEQEAEEAPPPRTTAPMEGFACELGDVVLRAGGEEAWLAGALVLSEGRGERASLVLFVSPDAGGDRAVLARPDPARELVWLAPVEGDLRLGAEPPSTIERDGERFERKRRLPLHAERVGSGAPDLGDAVVFAEYTGLGDERLVVLASSSGSRAYRGALLADGTFDVLPGGKSTLEK